MSNLIHRVVLFKVTDADKQAQLLKAIEKLAKENSKVSLNPPPPPTQLIPHLLTYNRTASRTSSTCALAPPTRRTPGIRATR